MESLDSSLLLPPLSVLVVDRDAAKRHQLRLALVTHTDLVLREAENAARAKFMVDQENPAVMLVNLDLPGLSGFQLVEQLRRADKLQGTLLLFIADRPPQDSEKMKAFALGALGFVPHPPSPDIVEAQIKVVADVYRQQQKLRTLNQELEVMSAAANEASRAKSTFLANMSHELRTPLNGILGTVELLRKTKMDHKQQKLADIISGSGEGLLAIISDILDLSKIEAGRMQVHETEIDLDPFLRSVTEPHLARARQNNIDLMIRHHAGTPGTFRGDPVLIRQILFNLLSNAVKFTHLGRVILDIAMIDTQRIKFSVTDTGIGIAPDKLDSIFESFTQADLSTTRQYGGTGLGLSITRQLADMMGGIIGVTSRVGIGSTFWFELPITGATSGPLLGARSPAHILVMSPADARRDTLIANLRDLGALRVMTPSFDDLEDETVSLTGVMLVDPLWLKQNAPQKMIEKIEQAHLSGDLALIELARLQDDPNLEAVDLSFDRTLFYLYQRDDVIGLFAGPRAAVVHQPVATSASGHVPWPDLSILLVEDDPINRFIAVEMLEGIGVRVTQAQNGVEALAECKAQKFDMIFMDCMMPLMDGYQATQSIRNKIMLNGQTPIVALTANALQTDRDKCLAVGMTDYLSKPFRPEQLRAVMEHHLASGAPRP